MSMTQTTTEVTPSGNLHCPQCDNILPARAMFCASCGTRVSEPNNSSILQDDIDIATRYRITSLVRRRSYVNLLFALDTQQQRSVALRDINISSLHNDEARASASRAVQHEYDLLRLQHIPHIMPVIDLRHFQRHLYVVAGWPGGEGGPNTHLYTLQDVLQSGIGLPDGHIALAWIEGFCASLEALHRHQIVIGDLDPQAIILSDNSYTAEIALMVSWLPPSLRTLLPEAPVVTNTMNFGAPEALLGTPEPRSDIYSLGAILYFLLTAMPPDEPTLRRQRRLRLPSELNSRISSGIDEVVMQALALETAERFQSTRAMAEALADVRAGTWRSKVIFGNDKGTSAQANGVIIQDDKDTSIEQHIDEIVSTKTATIKPLRETSSAAWQFPSVPITPQVDQIPTVTVSSSQSVDETAVELDELVPPPSSRSSSLAKSGQMPLSQRLKQRVTGLLPAIPRSQQPKATPAPSFLERLQRIVRGEQKHTTTAAAIVETPLRIQPNQSYVIRISLMGRNEPTILSETSKEARHGGLSALIEGEEVYIEVRSALYQSYAYIVQQATVTIPAPDYAAEVTIPMQPLSKGPSGRRDRLHIFFMDGMHRPLYEKPFVVELFISHLVQPGREGHNVLTIPL